MLKREKRKKTEDKAAIFIAGDKRTAKFLNSVEVQYYIYENDSKRVEKLPPPPHPNSAISGKKRQKTASNGR